MQKVRQLASRPTTLRTRQTSGWPPIASVSDGAAVGAQPYRTARGLDVRGRRATEADSVTRRPVCDPASRQVDVGQLTATILPSRPCDSSSGPALNRSSPFFAAFPLPNISAHNPSMSIGAPLAPRSWPRWVPVLGL
jgi:hypothetical protein